MQSVTLLALVSKRGGKMALCGMECIDLMDDIIKILGIYFPYNKIVKIQNILKSWKLRNLTIKGRIFNSLAILKIIHLALATEVPISKINF